MRTFIAAILSACVAGIFAADAPADDFPLESLSLKNGARLRGLILDESGAAWEFAEITRPPGKPMHAVVKKVDRRHIVQQDRLKPEQKEKSLATFARFRQRAAIEAIRMEELKLEVAQENGHRALHYHGRWFRMLSSADEEMTRRVIVRLEQLFTAFRQLLPPRREAAVQPTVLLCGSRDEYAERLRVWGLEIQNPAFYSSLHHTIVAGSGLEPLSRQLAARKEQEGDLQAEFERRDADFKAALKSLTDELRRNKFSEEEIKQEVNSRRGQWENERKAAQLKWSEVRRRNEEKFQEAAEQLFARLAHEAFHAYWETYVYPPEEVAVPGWLNEGLAQIFENAQLDGDMLRIDAPAADRLKALKADLASGEALSITRVITSDSGAFLRTHDRAGTDRLYLYAWGLVWHLVFQEGRLDIGRLENYLEAKDREVGPVQRFERFVDQPLGEFEGRWQQALRDGK